jgi:hypothetical protein
MGRSEPWRTTWLGQQLIERLLRPGSGGTARIAMSALLG